MKETLTFIIPAYNDELTISTVVNNSVAIAKQLQITFKILVVNDASVDSTGTILAKLTRKIPELSIIRHSKNTGFGQTIKELYQKANSTWIFSLPGDYQIEPKELKKLWPHRKQADIIIGWRQIRHDNSMRLRQSHTYNMLLNRLFGLPLHDVNSVHLLKAAIFKKIHLTTSSAFVDAELSIRARRAGFRIIEVPILHRARIGDGAGGGKLSTIVPTIIDMIRLWWSG